MTLKKDESKKPNTGKHEKKHVFNDDKNKRKGSRDTPSGSNDGTNIDSGTRSGGPRSDR